MHVHCRSIATAQLPLPAIDIQFRDASALGGHHQQLSFLCAMSAPWPCRTVLVRAQAVRPYHNFDQEPAAIDVDPPVGAFPAFPLWIRDQIPEATVWVGRAADGDTTATAWVHGANQNETTTEPPMVVDLVACDALLARTYNSVILWTLQRTAGGSRTPCLARCPWPTFLPMLNTRCCTASEAVTRWHLPRQCTGPFQFVGTSSAATPPHTDAMVLCTGGRVVSFDGRLASWASVLRMD